MILFQYYSRVETLSTKSRWIVGRDGRRVKLACVNWVSHLETVFAEGLGKKPVDEITKYIKFNGFNCVRFTWPTDLATNHTLAHLTVRRNFESLGLYHAISEIDANNPDLIDLPTIEAYEKVVANMEKNDVMVILDNHLTKPGWCCNQIDGNGFFRDRYFDPETWIEGLVRMATLFKPYKNVVGMSLRNELRGSNQNVGSWFEYMPRGAMAVNAANPNVLIILSGLSFDTDLSFIRNKKVETSERLANKLVFEFHWYSFSDGTAWIEENHNEVCGRITGKMSRNVGFLLDRPFDYPLFLSEFGIDERGTNVNDNRYFSCLMAFAAELDLDWALWTLQGDYYLRQDTVELNEVYGLLNQNWSDIRNTTFLHRITGIQKPLKGPGCSEVPPYTILFHPATGLCLLRKSFGDAHALVLGHCSESEPWEYTDEGTLNLKGTGLGLRAIGVGNPVVVGKLRNRSDEKWSLKSSSKLHVASQISGEDGLVEVCLDASEYGIVVSNPCTCLRGNKTCDASSQWFKMVTSTLKPTAEIRHCFVTNG
ncbi:Glycoside hydrolase, family GH5 [Zostera marina]|uniref:Glycoside hydrolase, family GH5 n=1 Tax=Zostera marina TaxID=29655 RepID=A0A0K9NJ74_ZOSMR|nr:Glycoside hydrolase, family GH5 [Zostera marina]